MLTAEQTITDQALNKATSFAVNYKTSGEIPNKEAIATEIKKDIERGIYKNFPKLKTELTRIVDNYLLSEDKGKVTKFEDFLTLAQNEYI